MSASSLDSLVPSVTWLPHLLPSGPGNQIAATAIGRPGPLTVQTVAKTTPMPRPPPVPTMVGAVSTPMDTSIGTSSLSSTTLHPVSN